LGHETTTTTQASLGEVAKADFPTSQVLDGIDMAKLKRVPRYRRAERTKKANSSAEEKIMV
jgi:hypothetical protein